MAEEVQHPETPSDVGSRDDTPSPPLYPTATVEIAGAPAARKRHHISAGQIVGIIIGIIVFIIVIQLIGTFVAAGKAVGAGFNKVFGAGTSALAWALSHWYLFLAGWLLLPFVTGGARWAARKWSDAKKMDVEPEVQSAVEDAIVAEERADAASKATDPAERQKLEEQASEARARYEEKVGDDPELKEKTEDALDGIGVKVPAEVSARAAPPSMLRGAEDRFSRGSHLYAALLGQHVTPC